MVYILKKKEKGKVIALYLPWVEIPTVCMAMFMYVSEPKAS